jgi:hypothetical protein
LKYPQIFLPDRYLDALLAGRSKSTASKQTGFEEAVILCDYCLADFLAKTNPKRPYAGGWLTDERCPMHKTLDEALVPDVRCTIRHGLSLGQAPWIISKKTILTTDGLPAANASATFSIANSSMSTTVKNGLALSS